MGKLVHERGGNMGLIGFILSLVAGGFMLIGLIPLLGWLNWITTLPIAIVAVIFSAMGMSKNRGGIGVAGLVIGIVVILVAIGRLHLGCGIL
jgi:hypothetical protein